MNLIKYFWPDSPQEPTAEEKAGAESFKNILKYGIDIGGMYKEVNARQSAIYREKREIEEICEKAIMKQQGIVLKKTRHGVHNWNSIHIRSYRDCEQSPLGVCVTMNEFGSDNPNKEDPNPCFYCKKDHNKK